MTAPLAGRAGRLLRRERAAIGLLGALLAVELLGLGGYLLWTGSGVTAPRYLLYPFVWVNAAVLAVRSVSPPAASARTRVLAGAGALGYLGLLSWVAGLLGVGHGGPLAAQVYWLPPGWGPLVAVSGPVSLSLVPFRLVGYLGLAGLGYVTALRLHARASSALGGVVGLGSCVSCAAPLLSGVASGLLGGSVSVATRSLSYDLSTAVFLAALGLLWYAASGGRR
ncbi:MAG: hypothetical protein ABEJ06_02915 [Haloarculaceae archaeon]